MTATDKQSHISVNVVAIRIDIHPVGEEPNQHVVHVAPWVSHTTTIHEVPIK
jgi:hypothetical protein